ncbi:F-box/LRR-repeat protein 4-like [Aphidius gifuensis]|uniref:F-box/LRR-repeat protein 4-like n=1 Tax=Aphidius gifuensis TaxID=684658 RepID=UPI001CDC5EB1|nr:F-box/LRR-repeat protein 4-like [Aphidius gifuensis]
MNCQKLQYLGIGCDISLELANMIVEYCKNLKNLRIHNHQHINNTALKKLTELENLECLILLGRFMLEEVSIIAISNNCRKLKCLEIASGSIYGDFLSYPSVIDEISKLQYLEHLKLRMGRYLEDSTIIAIADNCKNLKSLDIRRCRAITEKALVALTKLENLQKLDVSMLNITDSFISKLKGLKELHCARCKNLTDTGIIQFIKNNPDLGVIDVSRIDNITYNLVIAANQVTKNRTNGIILHIRKNDSAINKASKSIIKCQWLVVE